MGITGGFKFLGKKYADNGVEIVYANDIDKPCCDTYGENFGGHIACADISQVPSEAIPEHDILVGGFPCQSFSIVGMRKGMKDPRGRLFYEMVRILKDKKPAAFIAENVKGLMSIDGGKVIQLIVKEFEKAGYAVEPKLLNAADFGVPQKRERVFIVGIRKSLRKKFHFPKPTHSADGSNGLKKWVALSKVVEDLDNVEKKYIFSKRAVDGMRKANKAFNKGRWQDLKQPCNTLSAHLAKVSLNGTDPVLLVDPAKKIYRRFTPREAARIQSFPENFSFIGGDLKAYKQIGNAIPPVLMWNVFDALLKHLPSKIRHD